MPFEIAPHIIEAPVRVKSDKLSDAIERAYLSTGCRQLIGSMYDVATSSPTRPRGMCVFGAYNFDVTGNCINTPPRFDKLHHAAAVAMGESIIMLNNKGLSWRAIVTALRHFDL